jgi:hypothetical protein
MKNPEIVLKDWCKGRIRTRYREAYRLSLEIGLEAQDRDDTEALAQTVRTLDSAVQLLERARKQIVKV